MKRSLVLLLVATLAVLTSGGCATAGSRPRSTAAFAAAERGAPAALVSTLQNGARLSLGDIEHLAGLKMPDDLTLAYLHDSGATYQLTTAQIVRMRDAEVSDRVIDYLLTTPNRVAVRYPGNYRGGVRRHGPVNFGRGFGFPGHGSHRSVRH